MLLIKNVYTQRLILMYDFYDFDELVFTYKTNSLFGLSCFSLVYIIIIMITFIKGFLYARHGAKPFIYNILNPIKCSYNSYN